MLLCWAALNAAAVPIVMQGCIDCTEKRKCTLTGGHWFFLPGMYCWQMGRWALPKQDMAQVSLCIRQVARLLRSLHDTFAEVVQHGVKGLPGQLRQTYA